MSVEDLERAMERPGGGMDEDLHVGQEANVETLEGRFVTGVVQRVWHTTHGIPIALVVGEATVPWAAIRTIKAATRPPTVEDVFTPGVPPILPSGVIERPAAMEPPPPPVPVPPAPATAPVPPGTGG